MSFRSEFFIYVFHYLKTVWVVILNQVHFEFGLSRVLYALVKQVGMAQVIQNCIKKKTSDAHLPMRIMMMVINRLVSPCAKYSIEKWYSKSDLCNTCDMPVSELESQKVYRAMDKLEQHSVEIETALCKVISAQEGVSFQTLYLDFTNQETYSRNHDSELLIFLYVVMQILEFLSFIKAMQVIIMTSNSFISTRKSYANGSMRLVGKTEIF